MVALTRTHRSMPIRALAIVGCMTIVVLASQVIALQRPAPVGPLTAPPGVDQLQPAVGDLDAGGISTGSGDGTSTIAGGTADIMRIEADIAFWSARVAKHPDDFVS